MRKNFVFLCFVLLGIWSGAAAATNGGSSHGGGSSSVCSSERGFAFAICDKFCNVLKCDQGGSGGGSHQDCDDDDDDGEHHGGHKSDSHHESDRDCDDDHHGDNHHKNGGGNDHHQGDDDDDDDDGGHASECSLLAKGFTKLTGRQLTCTATPICPCVTAFPLFAQLINSTSTPVQDCVADTTIISVVTPSGTFALVNNGVQPPYCSVGNVPPFLSLTAADVTLCRNGLLQAAANRGFTCHPPE